MREEVEKIKKVLPSDCSLDEAIGFMLDKKIISSTAPKDAEIFYTWQRHCRERGRGRAVIATSRELGVSDRSVYYVREKFEDD